MLSRFRSFSEVGSRASRSIRLAAALGIGAALLPAVASAQVPEPPPPVRSTVDTNGVDLVSGRVVHSEITLSIGQPRAGGLTYRRQYTGGAHRDNFSGTLSDVGTCAVVSIAGSSEDCDTMAARGSTLEDLGGGIHKYTTRDGSVAEFSDEWASQLPFEADGGRITSLTRPNGERLEFHYEIVGTQCLDVPCEENTTNIVYLKSVTSNLGYQIKFSQTAPNIAVYAVNMAVDTCDPEAWTCTGLTEEVQPFSTVSTYSVGAGQITIQKPSGYTVTYVQYTGAHPHAGKVKAVTVGEGIWGYAYSDDTGADTRTTTVTAMNSSNQWETVRVVVTQLSTGLVLSDTDALSRTTSFEYDEHDRLERIMRPEGNRTEFTYDSRGNVTEVRKVAKPGSGLSDIVVSATYPATCDSSNRKICNKPISVTDERGEVTDFTYDPDHGGLLTITQPDPGNGVRPQTRFTYQAYYARYKDATGTIVTASTPVHVLTGGSTCATGTAPSCVGTADETKAMIDFGDMSPSVASNLLPVSQTLGAGDASLTSTTELTWSAKGNLMSVDGPLPGTDDTTHYRYDDNRRHIGTIEPDPDGAGPRKHAAQRITVNVDGLVTSVENGTVNGVTDPDWAAFTVGEAAVIDYDLHNRVAKRSLIAGGTVQRLLQYSYDDWGRSECTALRLNPDVYDSLPASACTPGTAGEHGADRITKTVYDNAGQVIQIIKALGTAAEHNYRTATFTDNGQVETLLDGEGNLTTYEYDGFDRVKKVRYPQAADGSISSTTDFDEYTYQNATGLLVQARTRDGQIVGFAYDGLGQVISVDKPTGEDDIAYTRDNFGRIVTAAISGHTVTFGFDSLGRTVSESGPLGAVARDFDAAGRMTRLTWPDSFYVDYDYDVTGALTAVRENGAVSGPGVLAQFAYDDLGRRTGITRGNGVTTTYAYDAASRLESLTHDLAGTADDLTVTFDRNPLGQIMSRTGSNAAFDWDDYVAESTVYTVNGLNQALSAGGTSFSYDGRGNLTSDGTNTYTYDVENRLTAVSGGGTLDYDPLGRLYEVSDGVTATKFLANGQDTIAEYDASGSTLLRRYVHGAGLDEPLVWYEGDDTSDRRWLTADERGSIVAVTDDTGAAIAINKYDEFGMPDEGNQGRFQYTGQMWLPEVGLYHYKARTYSPGIGRFLQADPIGYAAGMNLYAYVGNDPVNLVDPSGLTTEDVIRVVCRDWCGVGFGGFYASFYTVSGNVGSGNQEGGGGGGGTSDGEDNGEGQEEDGCESSESEPEIDCIVVTAQRTRTLGGVDINFGLPFPGEQLWILTKDGQLIYVPTKTETYKDSCGRTVGKNVPVNPDDIPPADQIAAVIHTHPSWADAWPGPGDYSTAQKYDVYGITPSGTWVLRKGSPRGSAPTVLSGRAPSRPRVGNGGRNCK